MLNMKKCTFCQIIKKEAPANIVSSDDCCVVFHPLDPVVNGQILVVPKKHYENIFDINTEVLKKLILVCKKVAKDMVKKEKATGVNILHASGKDAQQSVSHFHFHVIPRYKNDGLDLWLKNI